MVFQQVGQICPCPIPSMGNFQHYSYGSLNEPPSLNEPAAILSAGLSAHSLHFISGCRWLVPTTEKIEAVIASSISKEVEFFLKNQMEIWAFANTRCSYLIITEVCASEIFVAQPFVFEPDTYVTERAHQCPAGCRKNWERGGEVKA